MTKKAPVSEIFSSIQGEGLLIGERQIFVRFFGCNLACNFCDTILDEKKYKLLTADEIILKIKEKLEFPWKLHKTLVLTGGEPLIHSEFIKNFAYEAKKKLKLKIMLETNGSLPQQLQNCIENIDIISADFKIHKYLKDGILDANLLKNQKKFLKILKNSGKIFYVKIICDQKLSIEEFKFFLNEIHKITPKTTLILQPIFKIKNIYSKNFDEFLALALKKFDKVLFLPQIHKFLKIK